MQTLICEDSLTFLSAGIAKAAMIPIIMTTTIISTKVKAHSRLRFVPIFISRVQV